MAAPELSKAKDQDEGLHGCSREALAGRQVLEASEETQMLSGKCRPVEKPRALFIC